MTQPNSPAPGNKAEWTKSRVAYVGAGLGGLILVGDVARDVFTVNLTTRFMRAAFLTLVLVAGGLLGKAWAGASKQPTSDANDGESEYHSALIVMLIAGIVLLVAAWWAVAGTTATPERGKCATRHGMVADCRTG